MDQRQIDGPLMSGMQESLRSIAAELDGLISSDTFPASVRPAYLADTVRDYPSRGGKRLRPALLIWCCRLLGGREEQAWLPAAAVEVYHNWTLVHDDIIDQDEFRRNMPTAHCRLAATMRDQFRQPERDARRLGHDFAMLGGDLQQAWANHLLLRSADSGVSPEVVLGMARRFQELGNQDLVSGEALDLELSLRPVAEIRVDEVLEMIRLKTGALLRLAAECGAMVALATPDFTRGEVRRIGEYAMLCGTVFQLRDDWLGIFGDETRFGKALGSDLREAKPTVLLLRALEMLSEAGRRELEGLLRREHYGAEDLARVRTLMTDCGASAAVVAETERFAAEAQQKLAAFPAGGARDILWEFADYLMRRER